MLETDDIIELLEFILSTTYFSHRSDLQAEIWYSHGQSSFSSNG